MSCPFLREGRARYCHTAAVRKLILDGPGTAGGGLCASPDYRRCDLVREDDTSQNCCPYLELVHVNYCAASPVTKLVPFSDGQSSPCTGGGHRYCDSYLERTCPHGPKPAPANLLYSSNHFWLDVDEDCLCHIGVDGFLADLVGSVDAITFALSQGKHRPAVSLTVNGVEWPLLFPNLLLIQNVNHQARREPSRIAADPYGAGWLFEGWELPGTTRAGLMGGDQAKAWVGAERERLARAIHDGQGIHADGGRPVPGVARLLPRGSMVRLFQEFFAKPGWTEE